MGTRSPSPVAKALAGLPRTKAAPLDPAYRPIFRRSEPWAEVLAARKDRNSWWLIKDVPIALFGAKVPSVDGYATDGDDDGVNRCQMVSLELGDTGKPWPLLVSGGFILDGYHRLAVVADRGDRVIDVLWTPAPKQAAA